MIALPRRRFLQASTLGLTAATYVGAAQQPNERVLLAVMGVRGRGRQLIQGFAGLPNVQIAALCEVDDGVVRPAQQLIANQNRKVRVERDLRRVLEDRDLTALVIAAPDHWHALATVWACQAGKHVYVEKPISHNLVEGRRMIEAARRHDRVVQVGTQRRSGPHFASAVEFVRSGSLGKVPFARTWIAGNRPNIGKMKDSPAPASIDYDLWLGPAPRRLFNRNRFHYNWHWNWDYGTGELGNNGIHALDLTRWLLNLDAPTRISSGGGKYFYKDDQQTPDTQLAVFDFPSCSVLWEHRIWSRTGLMGQSWGVALYGERGVLVFDNRGWHVEDGVEASDRTQDMDRPHLQNFIDCIRENRRPNCDIEEGHKSTRLCHLGNIAIRTGLTLHFDVRTETCREGGEANRLLSRTYRQPFVLPERV
ncbi:MAG: Gfo/Idh/MocA family oxidoreductase [Planctomycetes bacterium]|nr:Gfo/Idh/MocA family oxidoreductase [Planctomycetota bacterium]